MAPYPKLIALGRSGSGTTKRKVSHTKTSSKKQSENKITLSVDEFLGQDNTRNNGTATISIDDFLKSADTSVTVSINDFKFSPIDLDMVIEKRKIYTNAPKAFQCGNCRNCKKGIYGVGNIARIDLRHSNNGSKAEIGYCTVLKRTVAYQWGCNLHDMKKQRNRVIWHEPTEPADLEPPMYKGRRQLHNVSV